MGGESHTHPGPRGVPELLLTSPERSLGPASGRGERRKPGGQPLLWEGSGVDSLPSVQPTPAAQPRLTMMLEAETILTILQVRNSTLKVTWVAQGYTAMGERNLNQASTKATGSLARHQGNPPNRLERRLVPGG